MTRAYILKQSVKGAAHFDGMIDKLQQNPSR